MRDMALSVPVASMDDPTECHGSKLVSTEDGEGGAPLLKFLPDPELCGQNEVWKQCVSSTCAETSCKRHTLGPACTYDCIYGCYCAEGLYRNAERKCVTVEQEPPEEPEPGNTEDNKYQLEGFELVKQYGLSPDAKHPSCTDP
ncbi:hypothetical protein HPB49_026597 [Dermacentor silvarum]|nr:hypothetical protein HPB49_026597 [Dermacentor silvarum]